MQEPRSCSRPLAADDEQPLIVRSQTNSALQSAKNGLGSESREHSKITVQIVQLWGLSLLFA